MMSNPNATLRQRAGKEKSKPIFEGNQNDDGAADIFKEFQKSSPKDWDYKAALAIITILAFATRFFLISHPDEVVFDEVHFGKVSRRLNPIPEQHD